MTASPMLQIFVYGAAWCMYTSRTRGKKSLGTGHTLGLAASLATAMTRVEFLEHETGDREIAFRNSP